MGLISRFMLRAKDGSTKSVELSHSRAENSILIRFVARKINHARGMQRSARIAIFPDVSTLPMTRTIIRQT
ncbi:hypothetical protein P0R31_36460 [Bradyrhizobium yuanmingense]|uniref:hypothetical protein n=1 Tax=Bradyrhizobium yuanmingense TaxID=108015 RepID=UPI0023B9BBBD|nr:hypothetical protein [Bradyrhizobium yuanmingense]MDF0522733.1 hypothetical protein [Bradyrhizobium yuanmingense]